MPYPVKYPLQAGTTLRDYYPDAARARLTPAEARKEYNRLRKIANKRLSTLEKHFPESKIYREYAGRFPAIGKEPDQRVYNRLYEVSKYLLQKLGTVTGQKAYRKKAIASLRESGYDFINEKNFDAFTDFMDEVRSHTESREQFDSDQIVELFERVEEEKADPDQVARHFEDYLENEEKDLPKRKPTAGMTKEEVRKRQQSKNKPEERKRRQRPGPLGSRRGDRRSRNRKTYRKRGR